MQYITRQGTFDSGHRVMNERMKCFNIHGHTYKYELQFSFQQMEDIGYALDFKEIKRVGCQWIDDELDHGMILNPMDEDVIEATNKVGGKLWLMTLNGTQYCNPSVENLAREVFMSQEIIFEKYPLLNVHHLRLYETPNCYTDCYKESITELESINFYGNRYEQIKEYAAEKGIVEYDDRKSKPVAV